jgi:hypothetical protein
MHYDSGKSNSLASLVPLFAKVANLLAIAVMENIGAIYRRLTNANCGLGYWFGLG